MAKQPAKLSKRELRRRKIIRRRRIFAIVLISLFFLVLFCVYKLFLESPVRQKVSWEAGSGTPTISLFLKDEEPGATMLTHMGNLDLRVPGDYTVEIQIGRKTYRPTLTVVDTIPPEGTPVNLQEVLSTQIDAESFVTNIQDATDVTVSYAKQPDFSLEGTQDVSLVLKDAGGNRTSLTAKLTLTRDTTPPVIEGTKDWQLPVNSKASFADGVAASDNHALSVKLEIDDSKVDLSQPGTYPLVYSARDNAGNQTTVTVTVTVTDETNGPEGGHDDEEEYEGDGESDTSEDE